MKKYLLLIPLIAGFFGAFSQPKSKPTIPPPPPGKKGVKVSGTSSPKDLAYLVPKIYLSNDTIEYKPKRFFIAGIENLTGSDSIGYAILPRDYKKQKICFASDQSISIFNYMRSIVQTDSTLYPVILKIKKLSIVETQITKADLESKIDMYIEVHCVINGKPILLDAFLGSAKGSIYVGSPRMYDDMLKEKFRQIPESIDELLSNAIANHPAFLKGVKVNPVLLENTGDDDSDTLIVDNKRYLLWTDYKGTPISEEGCFQYSTILMDDERAIKDQYLEIKVKLGAIILRNKSWAGKSIMSGKLLNHEHYQSLLTYLYVLKFKKKIKNASFTIENCSEKIGAIYAEINNELLTEIQRYFYETKSGSKTMEQNAWEEKIDNEIKQLKDYAAN